MMGCIFCAAEGECEQWLRDRCNLYLKKMAVVLAEYERTRLDRV